MYRCKKILFSFALLSFTMPVFANSCLQTYEDQNFAYVEILNQGTGYTPIFCFYGNNINYGVGYGMYTTGPWGTWPYAYECNGGGNASLCQYELDNQGGKSKTTNSLRFLFH